MLNADKFISVDDAAAILQTTAFSVRRLIKEGLIPSWRLGPKLIRLSYADVMALKKARQEAQNDFGNLNDQVYARVAKKLDYPSQK